MGYYFLFFRERYCFKLLLLPRSFSFRFVVIYYYYFLIPSIPCFLHYPRNPCEGSFTYLVVLLILVWYHCINNGKHCLSMNKWMIKKTPWNKNMIFWQVSDCSLQVKRLLWKAKNTHFFIKWNYLAKCWYISWFCS